MAGPKRTEAADSGEHPLVPNRVLQQMYLCALGLQRLERTVGGAERPARRSKTKPAGHEASLASLAVSLTKGDLLSEAAGGVGLGPLQQATTGKAFPGRGVAELPAMAVTTERLLMTVGAAVALKAARKGQIVAVTVGAGEVELALWGQMLEFVARLELPMLFVVLPAGKAARPGRLSGQTHRWGVPGFPVDAADAVAMYRVVQESVGRLRGGGGPVLIECIPWQFAKEHRADPVARLRELLRARDAMTPTMLDNEEQR